MTGQKKQFPPLPSERFLPSRKTIREASDDELDARYDDLVDRVNDAGNVAPSAKSLVDYATFIREEQHRRAIERSSQRIERLTIAIGGLTIVNVVFVIIATLTGF